MAVTAPSALELSRELASMSADQIDVALLWRAHDDRLTVSVVDRKANDSFELEVGTLDPMHVFRHPYAFTATMPGATG